MQGRLVKIVSCLLIMLSYSSPSTAQSLSVEGDGIIEGHLGVGTQNPAALVSIRAEANDFAKLLNFAENDNLSFFFEAGFAGVGVTGNTLKLNTFGNNNTLNAMTWRGDGRVGIGTTNPLARLNVQGGADNTGFAGGYLLIGSTETGQANLGLDRNSIQGRLDGGPTSLFLQPFGGNVGIGTDNPSQKLDVAGNMKIGGKLIMNAGATNIFIGEGASPNSSPQESVIIGYNAGNELTTSGNVNTFVGKDAGRQATNAVQNVAIGANAGEAIISESFGVYVGAFAGELNASDDAVYVGYDANANSAAISNVTAIGSHALATGSNRVVLGNITQPIVQAYGNLAVLSDGRFKSNVSEQVAGLDFILGLRAVSYQMDTRALDRFLRSGMQNRTEVKMPSYARRLSESSRRVHTGFIAQEVEAAAEKCGIQFDGLVKPENDYDHYGLKYAEFVVPLVKAVQEQQEMIKAQQMEIANLKKELEGMNELSRQVLILQETVFKNQAKSSGN